MPFQPRDRQLSYSVSFRLRLELPQDIDDYPSPVPLCQMQVIDPAGCDDLGAGAVSEDIKHGDIFQYSQSFDAAGRRKGRMVRTP